MQNLPQAEKFTKQALGIVQEIEFHHAKAENFAAKGLQKENRFFSQKYQKKLVFAVLIRLYLK
ncbi:hypothetical protein SAMD00079811_26600 [Scytonema sp. HK-05]|uniref:hypothetical protein n=1 Tax=Scytonema sp. HK-05 TaxID=1137095 RepID=UPI0009365D5F|nr:hypothetical protein [Scytonema sp. HK-05]OKH60763.1 hypothetical protein NIES2130_01345 [Scytonema sp. HK-05]BAY45058.1 hypothetical protein SAMD00079811_26600 [Scytonema sp. HK-05]